MKIGQRCVKPLGHLYCSRTVLGLKLVCGTLLLQQWFKIGFKVCSFVASGSVPPPPPPPIHNMCPQMSLCNNSSDNKSYWIHRVDVKVSAQVITFMHQSQPSLHSLRRYFTVHLELWPGNHLIWCNATFNWWDQCCCCYWHCYYALSASWNETCHSFLSYSSFFFFFLLLSSLLLLLVLSLLL